ncbi:Hypothetical predicted protein [Podarcis lilfordi]|uniref:Uncharacterized protein n=1 Tax=Podarcis lilfordi TaxID=74358 RepID=A0AA35PQT6_9SAUR|nr:Hypothetical predicted protein [Podarcis lilfordi]
MHNKSSWQGKERRRWREGFRECRNHLALVPEEETSGSREQDPDSKERLSSAGPMRTSSDSFRKEMCCFDRRPGKGLLVALSGLHSGSEKDAPHITCYHWAGDIPTQITKVHRILIASVAAFEPLLGISGDGSAPEMAICVKCGCQYIDKESSRRPHNTNPEKVTASLTMEQVESSHGIDWRSIFSLQCYAGHIRHSKTKMQQECNKVPNYSKQRSIDEGRARTHTAPHTQLLKGNACMGRGIAVLQLTHPTSPVQKPPSVTIKKAGSQLGQVCVNSYKHTSLLH